MATQISRPVLYFIITCLSITTIVLVAINHKNSKQIDAIPTPPIQQMNTSPTPTAYAICHIKALEGAKEASEENPDSGVSFTELVNAIYRLCLSEQGVSPQDLIELENTNSQTTNLSGQGNNCIGEWGEYNACLAEYNVKLTEYQSCQSSGRSYCIKPFETCLKPIC